jgi:hypothetical protein
VYFTQTHFNKHFFRSSWGFLYNRSYFWTQKKFQKFKKIEITPYITTGNNGTQLVLKNKETTENIQTPGD